MTTAPGGFHRFIHVCPSWLSCMLDTGLRRLVHDPGKILAGLIRPGDIATDIGCGPGFFTVAMARLAGPGGRVIAADIQERMLSKMHRRAEAAGLADRIVLHICGETELGIMEPVDFALAFWMVHEVPDARDFFRQVHGIVKPGGRFLFVEPKFHVTGDRFSREMETALETGFSADAEPKICMSRAVLFTRCN